MSDPKEPGTLFDETPPGQEPAKEPEGGTPGVEPNPADGGGEEQDKTPEPDKHTKTPEQIEADAAHWKKNYQEAMESLKALNEADDPFDMFANNEPSGAKPTATTPPQQSGQPLEKPLTREEMTQLLQEDPLLGYEVMTKQITDSVIGALAEQQGRMEHQTGAREANRRLNEWATKAGVTKEELQAANEKIKALGIKGKPAAIAELLMKEVQLGRIISGRNEQDVRRDAEKAEALKRAKLTAQPGTDADGGGTATKTVNEHIADKFVNSLRSLPQQGSKLFE